MRTENLEIKEGLHRLPAGEEALSEHPLIDFQDLLPDGRQVVARNRASPIADEQLLHEHNAGIIGDRHDGLELIETRAYGRGDGVGKLHQRPPR